MEKSLSYQLLEILQEQRGWVTARRLTALVMGITETAADVEDVRRIHGIVYPMTRSRHVEVDVTQSPRRFKFLAMPYGKHLQHQDAIRRREEEIGHRGVVEFGKIRFHEVEAFLASVCGTKHPKGHPPARYVHGKTSARTDRPLVPHDRSGS